ncbi:hypothetical protein H0B56_12245 [Haloechinothrix sp. YIM 98757]|uniref:Uncharacterized protein n=1 Tax=Haloechinothrix aidingensis TaxID=2752311 RepID=A0A838AAQ6_9PSEU|nr:hypothetical protein [Haloechinothrix aidingensis]MBA0126313.1 hypothetical protein [Haloechinothrix aidingensis]
MSDRGDASGMVFVDGREALAAVIVRPKENGDGVVIEANAQGISKAEAAEVLRYVAAKWEKDAMRDG